MIDIRLSDNLDLMAEMKNNTVDLIYCDILYGTGRKFKDYQDLKPKREIIEDHYLPRIKEMHRILKDTGSIYLQMDTKISHWIRCILDDIFGYDRFLNEVIWCYTMPNNCRTKWNSKHDNILVYTKTKDYIFNYEACLVDYSESSKERGKYGSNSMMGKADSPLSKLGGKMQEDWIIVHTLKGNSKEYKKYQTQKPKALIAKFIKASSNEGDLVADFYAGSFTTAEVCKDLNRNFIGCDISEKAVEIGYARVGQKK